MKNLTIIGLCRFSLVIERSLRWFRSTRELTLDEAKTLIYAPERLELRLKVFEASCLPSFQALHNEHPKSVGIVLIGRSMPDAYKHRLYQMIDKRVGVKIHELPDDSGYSDEIKKIAKTESKGEDFYSYRVDDDDGLSPNYAREILNYSAQIPTGGVLSCSNGIQMARYGEDRFRVTHRHYPLNAQGMGMYSGAPQFMTMLHMGNHHSIAKKASVTQVEGSPKWLRLIHADNDSHTGFIRSPDFTLKQAADFIKEWFPHIGEYELSLIPVRDTFHAKRMPA